MKRKTKPAHTLPARKTAVRMLPVDPQQRELEKIRVFCSIYGTSGNDLKRIAEEVRGSGTGNVPTP